METKKLKTINAYLLECIQELKELNQSNTEYLEDLTLNWLEIISKGNTTTEILIRLYNRSKFNPELRCALMTVLKDRGDAVTIKQEDGLYEFYPEISPK
jgi:hypothetical protein